MSVAFKFDRFAFLSSTIESLGIAFRSLDKNFRSLQLGGQFILAVTKNFQSAATGAVTYQLPSGSSVTTDYYIVKTDASVNAVTVTVSGTDTIEGASTYALAAQYKSVLLTFNGGVWYRISAL